MKIKHSDRGRYKLCTLASLQEDYNKFVQSGYNIKNVQCHNNVTEEAMFDVPVDQVFACLFSQIKILSRAVSTNSFYKRRGDRS